MLPADIQENEIINSVKLDGRSLSFLNKPSLLSWKYFDYSLTLCISYMLFILQSSVTLRSEEYRQLFRLPSEEVSDSFSCQQKNMLSLQFNFLKHV